MPERTQLIRISVALALAWLITPYIFGGGWPIANFVYFGVAGVRPAHTDPQTGFMTTEEATAHFEKAAKPAAVILSVAGFAFLGVLYGLVARHWQSTILVFLVTLVRANPAFFNIPFSRVERMLIVGVCQLPVAYGLAYLCSRIGIRPSRRSGGSQPTTAETHRLS